MLIMILIPKTLYGQVTKEKGGRRTDKKILRRVPLQGNSHSSNGDLPRTLPTELSNSNSGVSPTQTSQDEITAGPDTQI